MTGKAGFNIEFLPAAYFGKTYLMDDEPFIVPHYAAGSMSLNENLKTEPEPLSVGNKLVLAPEDDKRRVIIQLDNELMFFDGRNKAQNGNGSGNIHINNTYIKL
jgi:endoglucanase